MLHNVQQNEPLLPQFWVIELYSNLYKIRKHKTNTKPKTEKNNNNNK